MARIPTKTITINGRSKIVNADDPRCGDGIQEEKKAQEVIPSKSDIAGMKKADVVEWLEAHGVVDPAGSVADLRATLRKMIYLEG
jgi:hypothetical protein